VEEHVASGEWKIADVTGQPADDGPSGNGASAQEAFIETDWDTALDLLAGRFTAVKQESGGDAFAVLASAKCTNEENYLFNKFTRQILATNTIDHCARL
jgi:predicted molibdopterin-dependent oxidoreductase YjgC